MGQRSSSQCQPENTEAADRFDILLVEDNKGDVYLVKQALALHHVPAVLHVVQDGEEAIDFIKRADANDTGICPRLFLLDLNLPRKSGQEVLYYLRHTKKFADAPVLILTSSDSASDREETRKLGAQRYFRKPSGYAEFIKIGEIVRELLKEQYPRES
jgi:chemotaxis family two-component system response regulator Rcp1